MEAKTLNRLKIIAIVTVFLGPPIFMWVFLKYAPQSFDKLKEHSFGSVVKPAFKVNFQNFETLDNKPFDPKQLKDAWTYIYFDSSDCDEMCKRSVWYQRQTRTSQGKHIDKIKVVWVLTDTKKLDALKPELGKMADVQVLKLKASHGSAYIGKLGALRSKTFTQAKAKTSNGNRYIYLMNPNQKIIKLYDAGSNTGFDNKLAKGMRKDLQFLLKFHVLKAVKSEK